MNGNKSGKPGRSSGGTGGGPWADPADPRSQRHARIVVAAMRALDVGDAAAAKAGFRQVLDENIEHPDALLGMGLVARGLKQFETAAELIRRAIRGHPRAAAYWSNLGNVLQDLDRWPEAVDAHTQAVRLAPRHAAIRQNLASALNMVDRSYEALPHFREALRLNPQSADAAINYATVLARVGEYSTADRYFRQALATVPDDPIGNFHFGGNLIWTGRWAEGWPRYEARFRAASYGAPSHLLPVSQDLPESLEGKRAFLYREQGIGDEIRFATMVPDVVARGGEVTLEVSPKLHALFQRSFPSARVVAAPFRAADTGTERFDIAMPTGSLGRHLRTASERFPRDRVLLTPDPARTAEMKRRLDAIAPGPKIGLSWRSRSNGRLRSQFYASVADLEPIVRIPGVTFVNLQYDDCAVELLEIRERFGVTVHAFDDLDLFDDLDGAAALTAALDFVISANTSVATIAGGLGVPAVEFCGRPIAERYPIAGRDPWFPSIVPVGKRIAHPWERTMRRVVDIVTERLGSDGR